MIKPFAALLALLAAPALAQAPVQQPKPLFASASPLSLTLEAPIGRLIRNRSSDEAVAGTLADGAGNRLAIAVQLRGLTRRTANVCQFPPLSVRFTQPPPANSPFAGQRKLKLVTHCKSSEGAQRYILLEYATYKLYQQVTPMSLGARLATIAYVEPGGRQIATRAAFFIEDTKDLAARSGLAELRAGPRIPTGSLRPVDAANVALFQHMIGNHDWSMRAGPVGDTCCHNAKLFGGGGAGQTVPVPYDFDYSGLVDAPYALPPEQLGTGSVKDRVYRGYCLHNAAVAQQARMFAAKRGALLATIAATPGLDGRVVAKASSYLEQFFAEIGSDTALRANILARCIA